MVNIFNYDLSRNVKISVDLLWSSKITPGLVELMNCWLYIKTVKARYKSLLATTLKYVLVVCLLMFSGIHFVADATADDGIPVLTPVEDYRDFISIDTDPFRPDTMKDQTTGFTKLLSIDAVAARGNDIFIADTSQQMIFLIDRAQRSISKFAPLKGGGATDLYFASDFSLYVINQFESQVIQYSRDGRVIRIFDSRRGLSNPVAVVESAKLNRILVADSLGAHIAMFNKLGGVSRVIGQNINIPNPVSSIIDMASANGFIYLLDKLTREVRTINPEGNLLYNFGSSQLKQPVAIALDYCQRIFVADQFDNSIHVFFDEEPLAFFENNHSALNGFELVTDIWIDHDLLYVVDGFSGYIKLLRIEGGC